MLGSVDSPMPFSGDETDHIQFKNHQDEVRTLSARLLVALFGVLVLFCILIYRFYSLQVLDHHDYMTRADSNRIQTLPLPPTRGLVYDKNGVLLAYNRPSYTLSLVKEHVRSLDDTLALLSEIIEVSDTDRDTFFKALKRRRRPYEAVPLRFKLTEAEIAAVAVNEFRLGGVEVAAQLVRFYPHGDLFAHTLGYVGRINERELTGFTKEKAERYSGTHSIGKVGIEKQYENRLLGQVGWQHIEKNAHGRILRVLRREDPIPGDDLHLHLDINLQRVAAGALGENRGAMVAIEVQTGGILAMVSGPSYDPNLFVTGISHKDYSALNGSKDLPLFDRTIQGQYPPGSTLKPMIGLGGLEAGVVTADTNIPDPGYYQLSEGQRLYRCWKKWGHGKHVDLRKAIMQSCNTYFYALSVQMGIDQMHPLGVFFGLGSPTGIDIPNERRGLWPSRPWKEGAKSLPWFPGDSLNVSIGQGFVLATPLQLAAMTSAIASRGELYVPQLAKKIGDTAIPPKLSSRLEASDANWDYIIGAMEGVIHGARGTAKALNKGLLYRMAGKSGTAQVVGIADDEDYDREKVKARNRDQALFVAFAPADNPKIAVAVIFENGEFGSSVAAPAARKVIDEWYRWDVLEKSKLEKTPAEAKSPAAGVVAGEATP